MSINIYPEYVFSNKLVSPNNGYSRKRITKANIHKFGFNSIEELHESYPEFPLNCNDTLQAYHDTGGNLSIKQSEEMKEVYTADPHTCTHCGITLDYKHKYNKFCSSSCSAKHNNTLRESRSEESRIKTGDSLKKYNKTDSKKKRTGPRYSNVTLLSCACCDKRFYVKRRDKKKLTCSPECARKNSTYRKIIHEYDHQGEVVLLESSWEVEIAKWLDCHDVQWSRPKHIPWTDSCGKKRKYFPDFYIPFYDLYLDPKNDYQIHLGKEKLEVISTKINLIYGKVNYITSELTKYIS